MERKQNIVTTLLLLLWAAMFCFSVFFTIHKQPAPEVLSYTSAYQNKEKLSSQDQQNPVAWTEPASNQLVTGNAETDLTFYTSVFWSLYTEIILSASKPVKSSLASKSITSLFGIQPNAP